MAESDVFPTVNFKRLVVLMMRLHAACIEAGNDSEAADAIRDEMDGCGWHNLSMLERGRLQHLSAMLNTFADENRLAQ